MLLGVQRLLNYVVPEAVHIMEAGRIIYSGGLEVADILESDGYGGHQVPDAVKKLRSSLWVLHRKQHHFYID